MSFFNFKNRYFVNAVLVMETPVSVGSRISLIPTGSDLPVVKTPEGIPFIPGSSLKGVIRAQTERILRTLDMNGKKINGKRLWACDPLNEEDRCIVTQCCENCRECNGKDCCDKCDRCKACMIKRNRDEKGELNDKKFTEELFKKSCTACRLFGSQWLASRIYFKDAILINYQDLLRIVEVRDGVGIDRDLGSSKPKFKYDFEVVPAGAKFQINIIAENVEEWEIGLLLLVLKAMERGEIPVGGKVTRGLGWGKLQDLKVERITAENLLSYLQGQPAEAVDPEYLINTFINALEQGGD